MRNNAIIKARGVCAIALMLITAKTFSQPISQTFSYTGSAQTFTVPSCVVNLSVEVQGAQGNYDAGSNTPGGLGGYVSGVLTVTPGQVLTIFVGGSNGYNGGGNPGFSPCTGAMGGNGGGASDIRINGSGLNNRIVVAGGGGGAGGSRISGCGRGTGGGGGGGYYGGGGGSGFPQTSTIVPTGGTQTSGGIGGTSTYSTAQNGMPGSFGLGGNGGGETSTNQGSGHLALQGGHGGGLTGNNGQQPTGNQLTGQSGAGGSSHSGNMTQVLLQAGMRSGNGLVTFSYNLVQPVAVSTSATLTCINSSVTLSTGNLQSYSWSTGATTPSIVVVPGAATVYSLSGMNASGCAVAGSVAINVNTSVPVMTIANSSPVICPNHTVMLTAGGALSYSWSGSVTNGIAFTPAVSGSYTVSGSNACGTSTAVSSVSIVPLPVAVSITPTHICAGTSVTLSASGASSYTWIPGNAASVVNPIFILSPDSSGTYTVLGKTSSCSGTAVVSLQVDPSPTLTIAASSSLVCIGDSAVLTVSGAQSYSWSGGQTSASVIVNPSVNTLYSVTGVNAFNCQGSAGQAVLINALPTVAVTASDYTVCSGGASTLLASGAATYSWSGNAITSTMVVNPAATGNYSVTGTDANGCRNDAAITVYVFLPTVAVSSSTSVCSGDAVMIGAHGASSYSWSTGEEMPYITVTPSVNSTYTLNAMVDNDDGLTCPASNTVNVAVNAIPQVTVSNVADVICRGTGITLEGSGAATYTWSGQGVNHVSCESLHVSPVCSQTYSIVGTDANGCSGGSTFQLNVTACTAINSYAATQQLSVYPNPSNGEFIINTQSCTHIAIEDQAGREVRSIALNENERELKINDLDSGIYFVTAGSKQNRIRQKIIISK